MAIAKVIHEAALGCGSIAFEDHALEMMTFRGVSEEDVIDVLRSPDIDSGLPADLNRRRFRKLLGKRSIDVIFEHDPTQIVVVTVLTRAKK